VVVASGILTWALLPVMVTTERQVDSDRMADPRPPQGQSAPIDNTPPQVFSIRLVRNRQPNVSDVIWHVIFSEPVRNVSKNGADFRTSANDATIAVRQVGDVGQMYIITAAVGDLERYDGTITLSFAAIQDIEDAAGNRLTDTTPTGANENIFMLDSGATDREDTEKAAPELPDDTHPPEPDHRPLPREDEGDSAPREDTVPEAPPDDDGNAAVTEEHGAEPSERIYPRISSLVRQDPSDYRTNADSVTWRITFTEAVTNVDARDFAVVGRPWRLTVRKVDESANVYDITLDSRGLADHSGTVTLGFSRGMYIKNLDGNRVLNMNVDGRYEASFVLDNAAPTVIFDPESGRIGDAGGNLMLKFSEAVYSDSRRTPFTAATLAGLIDLREDDKSGAPIPFTASIDPDDGMVTIEPTGALPFRTWVRARNSYHDTAGNAGVEASATFVLDTTRPTVTIDGVPATDSGAFMATFTFSEPVTGFTASDVAVTNATASAVTEVRDGRQWYVRITPIGDYRVALPADRVTDLAGNGNTASTTRDGSHGADVTDPRLVSIVRQAPSSSPTRADSITWRVTFSEDVEQFNVDSVALLDHESQVPVSGVTESITAMEGSAAVYDVTFSGIALANHNGTVRLGFLTIGNPDNWVSVSVRDRSNRTLPCCGTLGADERTLEVDNVAPRVADIVRSSPGREHTNHDEVAWTVTFSEAVRNLRGGDFTIAGTDAAITVTPEGNASRTWNVIASGGNLASLNGTIKLSFAGMRDIEDMAGNVLAAIAPAGADEDTFVIDNVAPALISIARQPLEGSPADAETATWRLTFSEDVQGIDAADFAIHGGTIAVAAASSQAVYDLSVSGEDVLPVRRPISVYLERESDITDLAGNALRVPRPPTTIVLPSSAATSR